MTFRNVVISFPWNDMGTLKKKKVRINPNKGLNKENYKSRYIYKKRKTEGNLIYLVLNKRMFSFRRK